MTNLKMFDDGNSLVIAETAEEATRIWCEHTGENPEDYVSEDGFPFSTKDPALCQPLGFFLDDKGNVGEEGDGPLVKKSVVEWIEQLGRGYVASRER